MKNKNLKILLTSPRGFCAGVDRAIEIVKKSLPRNIQVTHQSLFDNSIEGIRLKSKPIFSVQYHPESNPGPQDSVYLFEEFVKSMKKNAKKKRH